MDDETKAELIKLRDDIWTDALMGKRKAMLRLLDILIGEPNPDCCPSCGHSIIRAPHWQADDGVICEKCRDDGYYGRRCNVELNANA